MRAHTITTKASTIVSGGILALGLAVVLLAATASTASAETHLSPWYCQPPATPPANPEQLIHGCAPRHDGGEPSFGFGDRQVGTTSPAQRFALAVLSNDPFNPTISVSGDYAQTNNCPATLLAVTQVEGCLITVTFSPTDTGPKHGTLSTGPGGPTMALTGKGVSTPTPWDWAVELSGDKNQNPTIRPGSCDGPTPPYSCGACDSGACAVTIEVSCGGGSCTGTVKGKLTKVKNDKLRPRSFDLVRGERKGKSLVVPKQMRIQAGKALAEGKKVVAKVSVRAKDAAGNVTTARRTIKMRLPPARSPAARSSRERGA